MNIDFGSHKFKNVEIPILWGVRAILTDRSGNISAINLSGDKPVIELLGGRPAPSIPYELISEGFKIYEEGSPIYWFNPSNSTISSISLHLPDIQIEASRIRVGSNTFSSNMVSGSPVGIVVDQEGIGLGAPMPPGLAKLQF